MKKQKIDLNLLKESMKLAEELKKLGHKKKDPVIVEPHKRKRPILEGEEPWPLGEKEK
ncbi:hypothetical protein M0R19_05545 [Candidatus Pacearchaeota archaeon]|nr:hypothetical protein [Candidatus Pacearchaeota archaeon]